jgi:transposase
VRERLGLDPLAGHLFLFRNRRGDRLELRRFAKFLRAIQKLSQ